MHLIKLEDLLKLVRLINKAINPQYYDWVLAAKYQPLVFLLKNELDLLKKELLTDLRRGKGRRDILVQIQFECQLYIKNYRDSNNQRGVLQDFYNLLTELDLLIVSIETKQLQVKPDKKRKTTKTKKESFETVFFNKNNAVHVKQILETRGYTRNGKWVGLTTNQTELLCAIHALIDLELLKPLKMAPLGLIFYNEFGLSVPGYMSTRSLNANPKNHHIEVFSNMFQQLK